MWVPNPQQPTPIQDGFICRPHSSNYRLNYAKVLITRPRNSVPGNARVECDEPTVSFDGKRHQIDIGELFGTNSLTPVSDAGCQKARLVRPELVMVSGSRLVEPFGDKGCRQAVGVRRLGHDPQTPRSG